MTSADGHRHIFMSDNQKTSTPPLPAVVDRGTWQAQLDTLLVREKAHTREGDKIAAARRRLPMVEVDPTIPLTGEHGPVPLLDVFEGRRQLIAYFHMWHDPESAAYRAFMGWDMPWYSVGDDAKDALLAGRWFGMQVCYLRDDEDRVYETYWSSGRAAEAWSPSYGLLDITLYGRQEEREDSPAGWPHYWANNGGQFRRDGRPTAQWSRLAAGRSDDLGGPVEPSRFLREQDGCH